MKNKILIILVPLVLASVMCVVPNLDTEYFAKTKPDSEKLVGKYLPTIETLKLIRDEGHYEVGANESISITLFSAAHLKWKICQIGGRLTLADPKVAKIQAGGSGV